MRRDVQYLYRADAVSVYNAFLKAASNEPFGRSCSEDPHSTISFGINFSMKYNMNGGSCIIKFFPIDGGTLVNMRFVIAQAMGARYEKYAEDLTSYVNSILNTTPSSASFDPEMLEQKAQAASSIRQEPTPAEDAKTEESVPLKPATPNTEKPTPPAAPAFCSNCGNRLSVGDSFCGMCGTRIVALKRFCTNCGKQATATDIFCGNCGKKL